MRDIHTANTLIFANPYRKLSEALVVWSPAGVLEDLRATQRRHSNWVETRDSIQAVRLITSMRIALVGLCC
jgi:hypothetical protein